MFPALMFHRKKFQVYDPPPCPFSLCLGVKVYSHVTPEPVSRISFRQSGQQLAVTEDKLGHVCCAMFIKLISSCLNSYHAHCIVQLDDLHVLVNFQRMKLGAVKNLGRAGGFLRQVELFKYSHVPLCKYSELFNLPFQHARSMSGVPQPIIKPEPKHTGLFINNEFVESISGKTFETLNPATGEVNITSNVAQ